MNGRRVQITERQCGGNAAVHGHPLLPSLLNPLPTHPSRGEKEDSRGARRGGRGRAFTLIELLVVIAIIGILAGLTLSILPGVKVKKVRSAATVQIKQVQTGIEGYKADFGMYPQDNPFDPAQPPLFYELTGTVRIAPDTYQSPYFPGDPLPAGNLQTGLGVTGLVNSVESTVNEKPNNFLPNLSQREIGQVTASGIALLIVPNGWPGDHPGGGAIPGQPGLNPLRYVVSKPFDTRQGITQPINNPDTYDLWAELIFDGKTNIIGNWRE